MAPEKLGEHKGWQLKKADVWAIATIAFEMFVGKRCFQGNSQREVFGKIMSGQWSWPQDRTPSDSMQDLIRQCLSPDAKDRPTAQDILAHSWFADLSNDIENDTKVDEEIAGRRTNVSCELDAHSIFTRLVSMVETNPLQDLIVKL